MDLVLVSVTGLSLVLALAMGVIAMRLLSEERGRADARVALLVAAAAPAGPEIAETTEIGAEPQPMFNAAGGGTLFARETAPSQWQPRAAVAIAFGLVATACVAFLGGGGASDDGASAVAPRMPLELVALSHTYGGERLEIRGLVQNPRTAEPMEKVVATVQVFGVDGVPIGWARAPLDFPALAPGDESPFVISVPVGDTVSRYRVGFRSADGAAIAHVDRRSGTSSANTARGTGGTP